MDWDAAIGLLSSELDLLSDLDFDIDGLFDFDAFHRQIQLLAPRLLNLVSSITAPLVGSFGDRDETRAVFVVAIILKQRSRSKVSLAFPTLIAMLMVTHSASKQVRF